MSESDGDEDITDEASATLHIYIIVYISIMINRWINNMDK